MTSLHILLLSALQGLTEFLPVSSSGHLILFSKFTTFPDQGIALDVAVHLGSIFAVMIYFSSDVWMVVKGMFKTWFIPNFKNPGNKLFWLIFIGTIPVVIFGLTLRHFDIEFRDDRVVGWTILCFGIVLFIADRVGMTIRKIEHLTVLDAVLIGIAQCFSLIPGTSRSGITITMGRFLGLERKEAAKFSMLLSIPAIVGAATLVGYEVYEANNINEMILAMDGITYSFIASIFAIYVIMWWLKKSTFLPFVIYRIILGTTLLLNSYGYINLN